MESYFTDVVGLGVVAMKTKTMSMCVNTEFSQT